MPQKIVRVPINGIMTDVPFPPISKTEEESRSMISSQIQALSDRNEFLEDLIAELAVQVYSTPPNA